MGTAISRHENLSANKYLLQFVSKESISQNEPFWNRFLAFNINPPVTNQEQLSLDSRVEPLFQQLIINNLESGNVGTLIHVFIHHSAELLASIQTENHMFAWQTFNALFIIRCVIKYLVETLSEEQLINHFEAVPKNSKPKIEPIARLELFLDALIEIIVDVPLKDFTYNVILEAVNCLLVLLSVQAYGSSNINAPRAGAAERSVIYRTVMLDRQSVNAAVLMRNLLQHFINQQKPPENNNEGGSVVIGIAAELWSMLTFGSVKKNDPMTSMSLATNESPETMGIMRSDTPLANQALLLILVLTNHCTTTVNPYRHSLFACLNSLDKTPVAPSQLVTLFQIDFNALFLTMCQVVSSEPPTLLLYLILHRNQHFKKYVMQRPDLENLIIPILRTLYYAPESNSHHIYMSLIILLILSEDDVFNKGIHEIKLKNIPWYTERAISEITLGGLLILVVIRTIQYNMLKMRDKYLHTNCLAALANMSGQFRWLHPYVAQRLVSLFETLAKKHSRLSNYVKEKKQREANISDSSIVDIENNGTASDTSDWNESVQDIVVLEEVLRVVLEILNSTLCNQLVNNPNLVYTLLYKKHIFEPFRNNIAFQDVLQNIDFVLKYFTQKLDSVSQTQDLDVKEVLNVITKGAQTWPKDKLKKFPDLKFKYVEEDQPEEFFIPYVWGLVGRNSCVRLSSEAAKLFNSSTETTADKTSHEAVC